MSEDWVVDCLIGFLRSPGWSSPVNNFIDDNCVVFDQGDENKFAYTDVHKEYNALVENLLSTFTAEIGISAEQLAQACIHSSSLEDTYKKPLEQVLAAENFLLFKSLMVQKNIDLEIQALDLLKNQLGHAPDVYNPNSPPPSNPLSHNEEDLFQQALVESKREFETQKSLDEEEMKKLIDLATKESLRLLEASDKEKAEVDKALSVNSEQKIAPIEMITEKKSVESANAPKESSPLQQQQPPLQAESQQTPLVSLSPRHTASSSTSEAASLWLENAKKECGKTEESSSTQQKVAVQVPADLKSREAYLKRQRDHLLNIKRQARIKELNSYNTTKTPLTKKSSSQSKPETTPKSVKTTNEKSATDNVKKGGFHTGVLCSVIANKLKEQQH